MSNKSTLQTHNTLLQENSTLLAQAIEKANGLPDAGGGGITPSGTIEITENGTHDVTNYASANVNVPSKEPNIQPLTVTENGTYTPAGDVDGYGPVTVNVSGGGSDDVLVSLLDGSIVELNSDAKTIFAHACRGRENLVAVNLPSAESVSSYAFHSCTVLKSINAPNLVSLGAYCFTSCSALEEIVFPKASTLSTYTFSQCASLKKADFSVLRSIAANAFNGCNTLNELILRSRTMVTLANVNALGSTTIASGTGGIYVPASLVNTYKAGSNWSNYAAIIYAIEDHPEITGG